MDSTADEEDYVTIGTAFDVPEEDEPLPKPSKLEDQVVTDKQGRKRLHGAFTGGFSAGYFNTVGSKEGWSPSTFKSSRSTKNNVGKDERQVSKPEDFMDDEDFSEYGIAPKKLKTLSSYNSVDMKFEGQKQSFLKAVDDGEVHSAVPGGVPLDDLLLPRDHSFGIQLLKKMGWKSGQGVGEKVELPENEDLIPKKKVYGCALPPKSKVVSVDIQSFTAMLAPKDILPIKFAHKDNLHGIGYSSLASLLAIPKSSELHIGNTGNNVFRPTGSSKGICGQAFGIGIFEDEDECDVYGSSDLSTFDMTMCDDADPKRGWTGTTAQPKVYKDCLLGFVKSLKKLNIAGAVSIPMNIPNDIPRHIFPEDGQTKKIEPITMDITTVSSNNTRLSSHQRSSLLGEVTKTMDDISHWTVKWDKKGNDKSINEDLAPSATSAKPLTREKGFSQIDPKSKPEEDIPKPSLWHGKNGRFKPFLEYPEKQHRYELFLSSRGSSDLKHEISMTEWEKDREIAEFSRAAALYQPLTSAMSNRFVSTNAEVNEDNNNEKEPADKKAAEMEMFGKLTRTVLEWHPDPLLSKRMNIPNIFPNSSLKGVPSRNKKYISIFSDTFAEDRQTITCPDAKQEINDDDADEFTSRLKQNKIKTLKSKLGPLSHLNLKIENSQLGENHDNLQPSSIAVVDDLEKEELVVKPSIDIFKAIFENSDSESSNDELDVKEENEVVPVSSNISNDNTSITFDSNSNQTPMKSNLATGLSLIEDGFVKTDSSKSPNVIQNLCTVNTENEKSKKLPLLAFLNTENNPKSLAVQSASGCGNSSNINKPEVVMSVAAQHTELKDSISCEKQLTDKKGKHEKTKQKKKSEKKLKKHKKHKRCDDSDSDLDNNYKEKRKHESKPEKKHKKKKSKKHKRSSSSSSDDSLFTPSNAYILERLKKCL